jgi:RNA polymerase sigma-70 factor (ECF subfamily)
MLENEDAALVNRCLEGDTKAFGKLVEKYQKPIFNAALRMCGNYDDAKDIAQVTFVKAYEKLSGFDRNGKFFSWIYRIMMNETIDFLAYVRRHTTGVDENIEIRNNSTSRSRWQTNWKMR